jgi:TonB family protein
MDEPVQQVTMPDVNELVFEESNMLLPIEIIPNTLTVNIGKLTAADIQIAKKLLKLVEQQTSTTNVKNHHQLGNSLPLGVSRTQWSIKVYLHQVREAIEDKKLAQKIVERLGLVGNVTIALQISADGQFSHLRLLISSGDASLDRSAMEAIKSANGLVKRPQATGIQNIETQVIIKYQYGL